MREQILNLLGTGASQEDVLRIVGCSTDYIGELLKEPEFIQELREKRKANREEIVIEGYARLEQTAINTITKEVSSGMVDVQGMCRILETAAKNRMLYRTPSNNLVNPTVHLSVELKLPQGAENAGVTIDQKSGQILAIGDRDMTAMPVAGVQKLFKGLEQAQQAELQATKDAKVTGARAERVVIDDDLGDSDEQVQPRASARAA